MVQIEAFNLDVFLNKGSEAYAKVSAKIFNAQDKNSVIFTVLPTVYSPGFSGGSLGADSNFTKVYLKAAQHYNFQSDENIVIDNGTGSGYVMWLLHNVINRNFNNDNKKFLYYAIDYNPIAAMNALINLKKIAGIPAIVRTNDNIFSPEGGIIFSNEVGGNKKASFVVSNAPAFPFQLLKKIRDLDIKNIEDIPLLENLIKEEGINLLKEDPHHIFLENFHDGDLAGARFWINFLKGLHLTLDSQNGIAFAWNAVGFYDPILNIAKILELKGKVENRQPGDFEMFVSYSFEKKTNKMTDEAMMGESSNETKSQDENAIYYIDRTTMSEKEIRGFKRLFLSLNLKKAMDVPWNEVTRYPEERPDVQKSKNKINYWKNQKEVRIEFFRLLSWIKKNGLNLNMQEFRERLKRINEVLLIGIDGKSIYFNEGEEINEKNADKIKAIAGKFRKTSVINNGEVEDIDVSEKILELIKKGLYDFLLLDKEIKNQLEVVSFVADFYHDIMAWDDGSHENLFRYYLFEKGNNSLFMNMVNGMLRLHDLNGVRHKEYDSNVVQMDRKNFRKHFREQVESFNDNAMMASPSKGGIDFNANTLPLDVQGGGIDFNFPMPTELCIDEDNDGSCERMNIQALESMPITGFTPVIFQIIPITNLGPLLGITDDESPFDSAQDNNEGQDLTFIDKYRKTYFHKWQEDQPDSLQNPYKPITSV